MKTIVVLSIFLMKIMLCETSKGEDDLSEYFATSIVSVNEKIKSTDSQNKYASRGYWDQYKVTSTPIIMSEGSFSSREHILWSLHFTATQAQGRVIAFLLCYAFNLNKKARHFYYILTNSCQGYSQDSYFKIKASLLEGLIAWVPRSLYLTLTASQNLGYSFLIFIKCCSVTLKLNGQVKEKPSICYKTIVFKVQNKRKIIHWGKSRFTCFWYHPFFLLALFQKGVECSKK